MTNYPLIGQRTLELLRQLYSLIETPASYFVPIDEVLLPSLRLGDWLDKDVLELVDTQHKFFTPPHIAQLIIESVKLKPGDKIFDPCCGSGSFLTESAKYLCKKDNKVSDETFFAMEPNRLMFAIAKLNLQGVSAKLSKPSLHQYDVVLSDLFFQKSRAPSQPLYLLQMLSNYFDLLKPGGMLGVLVPTEDLNQHNIQEIFKDRGELQIQNIPLELRGEVLEASAFVLKKFTHHELLVWYKDRPKEEKDRKEEKEKLKQLYDKFRLYLSEKSGINGNEFQRWFSEIMQHADSDFVPIKTHGPVGDLFCDGAFFAKDAVFQCYSPKSDNLNKTIKKMQEDFEGAKKEWPSMKRWIFVYGHAGGSLSAGVMKEIRNFKSANPDLTVEIWGRSCIWDTLKRLPEDIRENLLGI